VAVSLCLTSVDGHAHLTAGTSSTVGIGWNPNPSTALCGGQSPQPALFVFPAGAIVGTTADGAKNLIDLSWDVVAGDGEGPVTIAVDQNGGTNFNTPGTVINTDNNPTVAQHALAIQIPSGITCSGPGNSCTLRVIGSNNWQSCVTFLINNAGGSTGSAPAEPTPSCQAANLPTGSFCMYANSLSSVFVPIGTTTQQMDAAALTTYTATRANLKVFSSGLTDPNCGPLYHQYLCETIFFQAGCGAPGSTPSSNPTLQVATPCRNLCIAMQCLCGLNRTHVGLYPCPSSTDFVSQSGFNRCQVDSQIGGNTIDYSNNANVPLASTCEPGYLLEDYLAGGNPNLTGEGYSLLAAPLVWISVAAAVIILRQ